MFEFIGELIGIGFFFAFGVAGFYRPYRLVGIDGTPREVEKRARQMKRLGLALMILSTLMLIGFLVERLTGR